MFSKGEDNLMIDAQLMKTTGLYQILDPNGSKFVKYTAVIQCSILALLFFVLVLNIYHRLDNRDVNDVLQYFTFFLACANSIYKTYSIIRHSDALWNCVQLTSVEYLSYEYHSRRILEIGRTRSKLLTRFFAVWWVASCCIWIASPLFNYIRTTNKMVNENFSDYQYNVLNLVFPVTVKFYNEHFFSYYVLESIMSAIWCHGMLIFDIITISICVALSYQLKTIVDSCGTFGGTTARKRFMGTDNNEIMSDEYDKSKLIIYYFKILVQDQQIIIRNMRNIYKILQPVILFQILADSLLTILLSSSLIMNYINGLPLMSPMNIRYTVAIFTFILHLYLICYLFGHLDEQKNVINFALYSSDWTEMSISFKKLMLYAMRMNNAENLKLRITITNIVNFELFQDIMRTTYSILSVLANKYEKKT